jgi:PPM family protein phosphatase
MKYIIEGKTDPGNIRKTNEDKFSFLETDQYVAALVCDGMGGYNGGALAAEISTETIINHFKGLPADFDIEKEMISAFKLANDAIAEKASNTSDYLQMGTTAAFLLIKNSEFTTAHLGDSRIYLIREKQIKCLTKDHSKIQQLMDEQNITHAEALKISDKNIITRALGINSLSKPDISFKSKVHINDIFIICSDGLTNYINNDELHDLATEFPPATACEQLIYLANLRGGEDNITVLIVKAVD